MFGRHVDWAARATELADGGHICVTRVVYTDAFSWITKSRIAWEEHGPHRAKPDDPPLDIFEPYNANIAKPMKELRGIKVAATARPSAPKTEAGPIRQLRLVRPWEAVARDGRDFAENGAGTMYWFKVPLGGISYPEGFRNFLAPALANPNISKIRFVLDATNPAYQQIWCDRVLPLLEEWAQTANRSFELSTQEDGGQFYEKDGTKRLEWIFVDLSTDVSPCFKLFVDDPDNDLQVRSEAQIFLSTAARTVRLKDKSLQPIRIPDALLRVSTEDDEGLIHALNSLSNQWDALFS